MNQHSVSIYITVPGSAAQRDMSGWRSKKPVIDYSRCTNCLICWIYCPEPAILRDEKGKVIIDYMHCKGCCICAVECPRKCIDMVGEL
ncbi:MAG: 4Fe-4S binding protein [Candidatus Caldarchaeum sp.]